MGIAGEIGLTALHELRRNLRSAKGLLAGLLFSLGGACAVLVYVWLADLGRTRLGDVDPRQRELLWREVLGGYYPDQPGVVEGVAGASRVLWFAHETTIYLLPAFILLVGFDQLAGELQHRSIRYTALRAHRVSLVLGKSLGTFTMAALFALALQLCAVVLALRQDAPLGASLLYALRFSAESALYCGVYVGLVALISALFRTPTLALMASLGVSTGLLVLRGISNLSLVTDKVSWAPKLFFGSWESRLLSLRWTDLLPATAVVLLWTLLASGALVLCCSAEISNDSQKHREP